MLLEADRTLCSRYELKYLVREERLAELRGFLSPFVRLDRFARSAPRGRYPIASLYLDTPDLRLYGQTLCGERNRFKLRLRTYSDAPDEPVWFEIKRRSDGVVRKRRAPAPRALARALVGAHLAGGAWDALATDAALQEFVLLVRSSLLRPALQVAYVREAYESSAGDPLRVTFDTACRYRLPAGDGIAHAGGGFVPTPVGAAIVEIKFTERYPSWLRELVRSFDLERRSVSKYAISMTDALGCAGDAAGRRSGARETSWTR